jgi:catechol 2,3-dioxygenase-like lactoylglutathione lyase family enzyme
MARTGDRRIGAVLAVRDVGAVQQFYVRHLGFDVEAEFSDPAYVILSAEGTRLSLAEEGHAAEDLPDRVMTAPAAPARPATMLVIEVQDCAAELERLRAEGVEPVSELYRPPWGGGRFFITDPEQNLIEIEELA